MCLFQRVVDNKLREKYVCVDELKLYHFDQKNKIK